MADVTNDVEQAAPEPVEEPQTEIEIEFGLWSQNLWQTVSNRAKWSMTRAGNPSTSEQRL